MRLIRQRVAPSVPTGIETVLGMRVATTVVCPEGQTTVSAFAAATLRSFSLTVCGPRTRGREQLGCRAQEAVGAVEPEDAWREGTS